MTVASSNSSSEIKTDASGEARRGPATAAEVQAQAPAEPPLIELHDVGVWYQRHRKKRSLKRGLFAIRRHERPAVLWALRHINVSLHRKQALGVVGHNGAGKSTLCLVLARILMADEGRAIVRGRTTPLFGLGTGFNPQLTGRANINLYAAFLGIPRASVQRQMDAIIRFSELDDFIDEPLFTYSTGMRARLGFSVAAILEPEILILDEVLAVGDRAFQAKSRARMMEMIQQSKLIVLVSHSVSLLRKICTHCIWLDHGQQRMFGPAGEVLEAYEQSTGGPLAEGDDDDAVAG